VQAYRSYPRMNLKQFLRNAMNPYLLRKLWSLVERSHSTDLLSLDDSSLVSWLIERLEGHRPVDPAETDRLHHYIRSKLTLIRDLAQSR